MKTVSDLLRAKPVRLVSVSPDATVLDAIKVLAQEDIGAAIVWTDVPKQVALKAFAELHQHCQSA